MAVLPKETNSEEYTLLKLSSAEGPVYRRVKNIPVRDATPEEIPLIDVSGIFSPSLEEREAVARQIYKAATTIGFFYMTNHGIPSTIVSSASTSALDFFKQEDEKKEMVNSKNLKGFIGWKPPATQRISEGESIDVRENFNLKYTLSYDPSVNKDDVIPGEILRFLPKKDDEFPWEKTANLPRFKEDILNYWRACLLLAKKLVHTFALSLSLPEDYFDAKVSHPDAALALNYYPSIQSTTGEEEDVSIGSHTDFQLFTILWQDSVGGLQVLTPGGEWINAKPIEGSLVVNIGDFAGRITNDHYLSTVHRAKNYSGQERLSMAFFFGFNLNETCGVLPSCVDADHPAKYGPISCEEWIRKRIEATFIESK